MTIRAAVFFSIGNQFRGNVPGDSYTAGPAAQGVNSSAFDYNQRCNLVNIGGAANLATNSGSPSAAKFVSGAATQIFTFPTMADSDAIDNAKDFQLIRTIDSVTTANPTVITVSPQETELDPIGSPGVFSDVNQAAIGAEGPYLSGNFLPSSFNLTTGDTVLVRISGTSGGSVDINGVHVATVTNAGGTEFSIPVDTSAATGTYTGFRNAVGFAGFAPYQNTRNPGSITNFETSGSTLGTCAGLTFPDSADEPRCGPEVGFLDAFVDEQFPVGTITSGGGSVVLGGQFIPPLQDGGLTDYDVCYYVNLGVPVDPLVASTYSDDTSEFGGWNHTRPDPSTTDDDLLPGYLPGSRSYTYLLNICKAAIDHAARHTTGPADRTRVTLGGLFAALGANTMAVSQEWSGPLSDLNGTRQTRTISAITQNGTKTRIQFSANHSFYTEDADSVRRWVRATVSGVTGNTPALDGEYESAYVVSDDTIEVDVNTTTIGSGGTAIVRDHLAEFPEDYRTFLTSLRQDLLDYLDNGQALADFPAVVLEQKYPIGITSTGGGLGTNASLYNYTEQAQRYARWSERLKDTLTGGTSIRLLSISDLQPNNYEVNNVEMVYYDAIDNVVIGRRMLEQVRSLVPPAPTGVRRAAVYYMFGQSNVQGSNSASILQTLNDPRFSSGQISEDLLIYRPDTRAIEPLVAYEPSDTSNNLNQHPYWHVSDNASFGPVVTWGNQLRDRHPGEKVVMVQLGIGSTALQDIAQVGDISSVVVRADGGLTITLSSAATIAPRPTGSKTFEVTLSGISGLTPDPNTTLTARVSSATTVEIDGAYSGTPALSSASLSTPRARWNRAANDIWADIATMVAEADEAIASAGYAPDHRAFAWYQGESDFDSTAGYQVALVQFMADLRELLTSRTDGEDMPGAIVLQNPFVDLGGGLSSTQAQAIRTAQEAVVESDSNLVSVETRDLALQSDQVHSTPFTTMTIGRRIDEALSALSGYPSEGTIVSGQGFGSTIDID